MTDSKTIQVVNVLHNLVTSLTPATQQGWEMAKDVVVVNSTATLDEGIVFTILGVYTLLKLWGGFSSRITEKLRDSEEDLGFAPIVVTMVTILAVLGVLFGMADLFDVWAWVGLFHPGLALAHQAIHKVLGG